MTHDEALAELRSLFPGKWRTPIAEKVGKSHRVGFTDGEFNYWLGRSDMGWRVAIFDLQRRIGKR